MITNPRPTRAEASDCANAILDGADAVMLSGETSVGAFPFEAVRTMARIVTNTEENGADRISELGTIPHTRGGAITRAAAEIGDQLSAQYLVTFTESGDTARRLSRLRPTIPLLALTPYEKVQHQLSLSWGIEAHHVEMQTDTDQMVKVVDELLREKKGLQPGDLVIIAAGSPPGVHGSSRLIASRRARRFPRPDPRTVAYEKGGERELPTLVVYRVRDLNPYVRRQRILSAPRLPIPPTRPCALIKARPIE